MSWRRLRVFFCWMNGEHHPMRSWSADGEFFVRCPNCGVRSDGLQVYEAVVRTRIDVF